MLMLKSVKLAIVTNTQLLTYVQSGGDLHMTFFSELKRLVQSSWCGALCAAMSQKSPFKIVEAATDVVPIGYKRNGGMVITYIPAWTFPGGMNLKMDAIAKPVQ